MRNFLDIFRIRNHMTCKKWDTLLNDILDNNHIVETDRYTAQFSNGMCVWIENKWYGYGSPYSNTGKADLLPKMKTARRLDKIVSEFNFKKTMEITEGQEECK